MCLYKFRVYQSREEYERETGKPCPEWDATKSPKYWEDPEAVENAEFSIKSIMNNEVTQDETKRLVYYDSVLAVDRNTGEVLKDENGLPFFGPLFCGVETARGVNIPPKELLGTVGVPVPVPCRELDACEELDWLDDEKTLPVVKNNDYEATMPAMFTRKDKEVLYKIAEKLGV